MPQVLATCGIFSEPTRATKSLPVAAARSNGWGVRFTERIFHALPPLASSRTPHMRRLFSLRFGRNFLIYLVAFLVMAAARVCAFDTVILDPGHGGHDRGAGIGYIYEKHLALDTARRVETLLKSQGFRVVMTRSSDVFIPLAGRASIGNSHGNAVFVSLHYNYNRGGSGRGVESYYYHDDSYKLAAYIQAYLVRETGLANRGVKSASFHVIRETKRNPAVLIECGFVSNSSERAGMVTGLFRERLAVGIVKGIIAAKKDR